MAEILSVSNFTSRKSADRPRRRRSPRNHPPRMFDRIAGGAYDGLDERTALVKDDLRKSQRDVLGKIEVFRQECGAAFSGFAVAQAEAAVKQLKKIEGAAPGSFLKLRATREDAAAELRRFQAEHGLARPCKDPDRFVTVAIILICVFAEGLLTAGLMIGDGMMDVPSGLIYGLSAALVNICAGLLTGYFGLRYAGFKKRAPRPFPEDTRTRMIARTAFLFGVGTMLLLHVAAARVRALGTHHGIFDFDVIGVLATFNDYYGIAILAVGGAGSILAIYKGYGGLSDPVPGYSHARQIAEDTILDEGADLLDRTLDRIETVSGDVIQACDDAADDLEDAQADFDDDLGKIKDQIKRHNDRVQSAIDDLSAEARAEESVNSYVQNRACEKQRFDLKSFHALLIDERDALAGLARPDAGASPSPRDAGQQVALAHDAAVNAALECYYSFRAALPSFNVMTAKGA